MVALALSSLVNQKAKLNQSHKVSELQRAHVLYFQISLMCPSIDCGGLGTLAALVNQMTKRKLN